MDGRHIGSFLEGELNGGGNGSSSNPEEYVSRHTWISHHSIGTCRMGIDEDCVVSPDQCVHNLENLWIADASVIPDRKSTRLNSSHPLKSRMPSSA